MIQRIFFSAKPCPLPARTLSFSNTLKRRLTAWPVRLPLTSWLSVPEILRTAHKPFTDEQTISNSQPVLRLINQVLPHNKLHH
ncbi:hypothetical protein PsorP6_000542 [Peronosclerospora sorghi]|uniref:Uncharacterized protein n=1 Tax=Peronosclerospora sorghi TaxID=230839 RepID=A0ACC0WUS4_9STRA|nr:hypothetical protein PsorP6_000542 [Peronosclerospora sorghi]